MRARFWNRKNGPSLSAAFCAPVIVRQDEFPEPIREEMPWMARNKLGAVLIPKLFHTEAGTVNSKQIFLQYISLTQPSTTTTFPLNDPHAGTIPSYSQDLLISSYNSLCRPPWYGWGSTSAYLSGTTKDWSNVDWVLCSWTDVALKICMIYIPFPKMWAVQDSFSISKLKKKDTLGTQELDWVFE